MNSFNSTPLAELTGNIQWKHTVEPEVILFKKYCENLQNSTIKLVPYSFLLCSL